MSFFSCVALCTHAQMSCLSNKPELSVKVKQKRMCHFKVTNQSDERISWISPDQVFESTTVGHMLHRSGEMQHHKTNKGKKNHPNSQITWSALRRIKPFHTGTKLKLVTGVDKRLLFCRAPSCGSDLGWPPTQRRYTTKHNAQLQRGSLMQMCPYANMLRLFTERGDGHRPPLQGPHLRTD